MTNFPIWGYAVLSFVFLLAGGFFLGRPKCVHEWEKVSDVVLQSAYEDFMKGGNLAHVSAPYTVFSRKHILVLKCEKCGKIWKSVEVNP